MTPSYGELAALAAEQAAQLAEQAVLIEALRVELEALRRRVGRDSSNSSQPPSTDGPGAKATAKAGRRTAARQGEPRHRSGSHPRGLKLAAKVQGCWRTLATLQRHCRIRSYLVSARNHGRRPIDAIRDALTASPWMPPQTA